VRLRDTRVVYVANARLPTEKAHGVHIVRMCEALARHGATVELWHPRRRQPAALRDVDLFDHYGAEHNFAVHRTRNVDVVTLEPVLRRATPFVFAMHAFVWAAFVARRARRTPSALFVTRDTAVAWWLTAFGLPVVFDVHTAPTGGARRFHRSLAHRPSLRMVSVVSSALRDDLVAAGYPPERIHVLPDAVDPQPYEALPSAARCRAQLALPDRPVIGYVGRFDTQGLDKGLGELVQAVAALHDLSPKPMLVCVGGPQHLATRYAAQARALGCSSDDARFADYVAPTEVPTWIGAADVLAIPFPDHPHFARSSPLKLFEYLAAGRPIVASALPGIADVVRHERDALLVEPGNVDALAAALRRALTDSTLARELSAAARVTARDHTWDARAAAMLTVATREDAIFA
jgi:glycosyltransferase involved in cell wall biosynthesis